MSGDPSALPAPLATTAARPPQAARGSSGTGASAGSAGSDGARAVDWAALRAAAGAAAAHAYAPYSRLSVGAAGLADNGRVVVGCNVENASYGLTLCAECSLVSALVTGGGGRLVAVACVDGGGRALMPCGRCRQLLWEHGGPELLLAGVSGVVPMAALLPDAFGAQHLTGRPDVAGTAVGGPAGDDEEAS